MERASARAAAHLDDVYAPVVLLDVVADHLGLEQASIRILAEAFRIACRSGFSAPSVRPCVSPGVEGELVGRNDFTRDGPHGSINRVQQGVDRPFVVILLSDVAVVDGDLGLALERRRKNPGADDQLQLRRRVLGPRIERGKNVHLHQLGIGGVSDFDAAFSVVAPALIYEVHSVSPRT